MKIAHLWYVMPLFGGAEIWAIGLSKALKKMGVTSEIVCWRTEGGERHKEFIKVLGGEIPSSPDIIDSLMNGAFMAKHLKDYDIVCPHHMDVLFPAVFSKSLFGNQVACMLHEPPKEWESAGEGLISYRQISEKSQQMYTIWKMFSPYSDFFFTNSKWNQNLHEKYEGISPVPLMAGVDRETFKPDEELRKRYRSKMDVNERTILLFYSAAAGRRKRHEIILRGLSTLVRKGYDVKCVLTCSKDRRTRSFHPLVRRIIRELDLEDKVIAFPATSEENIIGLYNACDIYVHPANNEHLGMAILEAMAVGKPIVAQANGGVPEIVENEVEGLLFKTDSINHMVECIERLIRNQEISKSFGKNAFKRAESFDWKRVADKFLQVIS